MPSDLHFVGAKSISLDVLVQIRDEIKKYVVGAPARVGLVAPNAVLVPAGGTGLDPSQTSFFQVLPRKLVAWQLLLSSYSPVRHHWTIEVLREE